MENPFLNLQNNISNKYILLDTGVVIRSFEHFENFEVFFKFMEECNAYPIYFPYIEFEFIRGAFDPEHRQNRKNFLHAIGQEALEMPRADIIIEAIKIANAYSARKHNSASLTDCCIAAYLKKYAPNLFLVTLNHKDFPTFLFNKVGGYTIDTNQDIFPLAFYQFDKIKAQGLGI